MQEIIGTSNKVLEVDLTKQKFSVIDVSEKDLAMYMGGKGLGLKMIYDRMPAGVDPLGEENMIAFMMGVLMGTGAPCSGRFAAVTKSPLTGIMVSASCGGPFGMALKTSGWDGIIVRGKSEKPVMLTVDSKGVEFRDAKKLWAWTPARCRSISIKSAGDQWSSARQVKTWCGTPTFAPATASWEGAAWAQ